MGVPVVFVISVGMSSGIHVGLCFQQSHQADHTLKSGTLQEPHVVQGDPSVQVAQHGLSHPFDQGAHQMLCLVAHADL